MGNFNSKHTIHLLIIASDFSYVISEVKSLVSTKKS